MEHRNYKTKSIVEAGIISAIIVVLMLITGYVPFIAALGTLILPIPVALLYVRHDLKIALLSIVASTIISSLLFNPVQAVLSAVSFSFVGLAFGYGIRKDKSSSFIILILSVLSLVATVLSLAVTVLIIQKTTFAAFINNAITGFNEAMKESMNMAKSLYMKAGMTEDQLSQINKLYSMLTPELIFDMGAAVLIVQAFMSSVINYVVAKVILKKLGYNLKKLRSFAELYINSFTAAIIIMPIPLGVYLQAKGIAIGTPILISGQMIMQVVFVVIGISVVTYFLINKYKLSKGIIVLIVIISFTVPMLGTIFIYVGLADMLFDFRKINPNRILKK